MYTTAKMKNATAMTPLPISLVAAEELEPGMLIVDLDKAKATKFGNIVTPPRVPVALASVREVTAVAPFGYRWIVSLDGGRMDAELGGVEFYAEPKDSFLVVRLATV